MKATGLFLHLICLVIALTTANVRRANRGLGRLARWAGCRR